MTKIISVNAGSSSLKFQLFNMPSEEVLTSGVAERIGLEEGIFTIKVNGEKITTNTPIKDHSVAVNLLLEREIRGNKDVLIVLDDDPTGTQTVHDVSVYTDWSVENIKHGLCEGRKVFYLLTNSRAMSQHETAAVHREIAAHILQASRETGRHAVVMSRSDSTLRGHYPLETDLLRQCFEAAGERIDGEILCPFFKEGGRFTLHCPDGICQGCHIWLPQFLPSRLYTGENRRPLPGRPSAMHLD